jgi:glycosyltransferase involved in cell wall biosynthesis
MNKILSIIIPVYNAELNIDQCINSVLSSITNESRDQIEIIVVDDKASDNSMSIIYNYQLQNSDLIKIIAHPIHKGLGGSWNTGIDNATGKFICFVDLENYLIDNAIALIFEKLKQVDKNELLVLKSATIPKKNITIDSTTGLHQLSLDKITSSVWNKIFPKELIKDLRFSEYRYYEDLEFIPRVVEKAEKITFYNVPLYNYKQDADPIGPPITYPKHLADLASVLITLTNINNEEVRNTIFFGRWAYLLKLWDINDYLYLMSLKLIRKHLMHFDLTKHEKSESEKFKNQLTDLYQKFSDNIEITSYYNFIINHVDELRKADAVCLNLPLKNEKPLFSIIIPVFNAAAFLDKAIETFRKQKSNNFEVIYIDDQSTDDSVELIRSYQKDCDFIQLHQLERNSGAGVARNFGISKAKGDYIFFNDSDDWLNDTALADIEQHLNERSFPDTVIFTFSVFDEYYNYKWSNLNIEEFEDKVYSGEELLKEFIKTTVNPSPWNKVFKRSFWLDNNFMFPTDIHHQDLALIPYVCFKSGCTTILKKRLYNYYSNKSGVTRTVSDKHAYSPFKAMEILFDSIAREGDETFKIWRTDFIKFAFLQFDYNFKLRKDVFNDQQIIQYINYFNDFCLRYNTEAHYLLNSRYTFNLINNFIHQKLKRGITTTPINGYITEHTFEKVFSHYTIIDNQHQLLLKRNNEVESKITYLENEIAQLSERNARNENTIVTLENEKASLPKWYLKVGNLLRRE